MRPSRDGALFRGIFETNSRIPPQNDPAWTQLAIWQVRERSKLKSEESEVFSAKFSFSSPFEVVSFCLKSACRLKSAKRGGKKDEQLASTHRQKIIYQVSFFVVFISAAAAPFFPHSYWRFCRLCRRRRVYTLLVFAIIMWLCRRFAGWPIDYNRI